MFKYYDKEVIHISGKNATKQGYTQIERARAIQRTLGTQCAARYMALRSWSLESALFVLAGV